MSIFTMHGIKITGLIIQCIYIPMVTLLDDVARDRVGIIYNDCLSWDQEAATMSDYRGPKALQGSLDFLDWMSSDTLCLLNAQNGTSELRLCG